MSDHWSVSWREVAAKVKSFPAKPPFDRVEVDRLKCKLCGGLLEYGTGWHSDGWMCNIRDCRKCQSPHIITDSPKFCKACHLRKPDCLFYPQVFIRKEH